MAPAVPGPLRRSERLYRALLRLYPPGHRREYGAWMTQLFRDLCRDAYSHRGSWGLFRLWLRVLPDVGSSAGLEHYEVFRRWFMDQKMDKTGLDPRIAMGLLVGAVLIALGVLGKALVVGAGGSAQAGAAIQIVMSLAAALVMEAAGRFRGAVLVATGMTILATLLPLAWVSDDSTWLRENPVNPAIFIFLAAFMSNRTQKIWPVYLVALIFSAVLIGLSFV